MGRFRLVDNDDHTMAEEILSSLPSANSLDVAAAYFTLNGYENIVEGVEALIKRGGVVRFLLGVHPSAGARALLHVLRAAQHEHGTERIQLRFIPSTEEVDFHAKVYITKRHSEAIIIVGSSNLTNQGLVNNLELNYAECLALDNPKYQRVQSWFDNLFENVAREYRWEAIEDLFTLPPFEAPPPLPPAPLTENYTLHFISLQLRYLTVPLGGRVIPFWYQMDDVKSIVDEFENRLTGRRGKMIAHEVGLGKTIVAGLTIKELLSRKRINRVLIICPASLTEQWQQEMLEKLDEEFTILNQETITGSEIWEGTERAIISIDLLKHQMLKKEGRGRNSRYVVKEDWPAHIRYDFVIFDESHYAKSHTSMRYRAVFQIVEQLRGKDGYLVLLTATPLQNREEELYYQLVLTYPDLLLLPDGTRDTPRKSHLKALANHWADLREETIRRKLRNEPDIKELFANRKEPEDIAFEMRQDESELYTEFARYIGVESTFYQILSLRAQQENSPMLRIVPFIRTTYLREFCSSAEAIFNAIVGKESLENGVWRLEQAWNSNTDPDDPVADRMGLKGRILRAIRNGFIRFGKGDEDELQRIQEMLPSIADQIEDVDEDTYNINLDDQQKASLRQEVERLNDFASRILTIGDFAKERALAGKIADIVKLERKVVVFVGYLPTGRALRTKLRDAGVHAEFYEGGLDESHRKRLIDRFWGRVEPKLEDHPMRGEFNILIATDAGGVGLNLQCANHVINYDLSWNPMIIEQRIGRIHRLGQLMRDVFVGNWVAKTRLPPSTSEANRILSIEEDVHETLQEKIELIHSLQIELSDEVIADSLLSDAELAEAELRYRTRQITKEEYDQIIDKVVERKKDELRQLSDLKALTSVTSLEERDRAVEQALRACLKSCRRTLQSPNFHANIGESPSGDASYNAMES